MNIKKITLILIALLSNTLVSAGVTPAQIESARSAGTLDQVWIGGASAPTKAIYRGWAKGCQSGTGSIFTAQAVSNTAVTPGSLGNFFGYACVRGTRTAVMYHTIDGGSLNAFTPFTIGTKLARLSYLGNANCTKLATGYIDIYDSAYNADVYKGCAQSGGAVILDETGVQTDASMTANSSALASNSLAPQQIVGGFSDIEPTMFSASIGGGNTSSYGTLSNTFLGQVLGVAVSIPLYRKLQEIQGIAESSSTYSPALAPSLTRGQIASILQEGGTVNNLESWSPILGTETGEKVIIQRRMDTSGTQAASNVFFLGNPCVGSRAWSPANATIGNYLVYLNSGSSDVKSSITAASNGAAGSRYAIGVLSLENDWRLENSTYNGYRYIKVDGSHPETDDINYARKTAISGTYLFHIEMQSFVANSAPAGFQKNMIGTIVNALKNPTTAADCASFSRGLTLNPETGNTTCTPGEVKAKFTNFGSNCTPAVLFE